MHKRTIYTQRERDRERLLKIKEHLKPVNKILEQIKVASPQVSGKVKINKGGKAKS